MIRLVSRWVLILVGVAVALGAVAQPAWKDSPAVRALYAQAKQEGKVVVWGPQQREVDWIPEAFGSMFPGIEVQWLGDNNVVTKAIAESRAGRNEVDVMHNSLGGVIPLNQRDMLAVVDWPQFGTAPSNVDLRGKVGLTNNLIYAVVYNKDKVKEADLPKNWTDLLDPKYKGKMVGSVFLLPRLVGFLGVAWGEEKALQFARDLIDKTDILLTRAPRESFLQSGERLYAIGDFEAGSQFWASQGLPVDYVIPQPVAATQFVSSVMAKAAHPNAARLLAGWMTTPEAKRLRLKMRYETDIRPGADSDLARKLQAPGSTIVIENEQNMAAREQIYNKANPILSGQKR
jgi:iron(III) transport system substrate-binding protein